MNRRTLIASAFVVLLLATLVVPVSAIEERDRLYLVGERAVSDGLHALGARVLERFVKEYPDDQRVPAATLLLGRAWLGVGLHERALEVFRQAQRMSPPPGRFLESRLWEGEALFRLKRYAEARAAFDEVARTQASPVAPDAMYGLAWTEMESRKPEAAAKHFRELIVTVPPDHPLVPSATVYLARTLVDQKRYADAATLLLDFQTKYPNHALAPDAQYMLGLARVRSGDRTPGMAELRAFIEANPRHERATDARRLVGDPVARVGEKDDPQPPSQPRTRESPQRESPQRESRESPQQPRIKEGPDPAEGLYETAVAAERQGRTKEHDTALRRLRKEFPDHPLGQRAALDLANVAFKKNQFKEAATLARLAAPSEDGTVRAEAWLLAGEAELKQKRFADAAKAFEKVRGVESADTGVRYRALAGLGLAHEEQQQWRPALAAYEAVASKSPDASLREWAQKRVKAVKDQLAKSPAKPNGPAKPKGKS